MRFRRGTAALAMAGGAMLPGCAPVPPATEPPAAVARCDNAGLERFTGMKVTQQLGVEALRVSGARALRWIAPGSAVTMDFSPDRLNIEYDSDMIVTRARCG